MPTNFSSNHQMELRFHSESYSKIFEFKFRCLDVLSVQYNGTGNVYAMKVTELVDIPEVVLVQKELKRTSIEEWNTCSVRQ